MSYTNQGTALFQQIRLSTSLILFQASVAVNTLQILSELLLFKRETPLGKIFTSK